MATLEKIRSKAALLVVVIGVALLAFIIGDFLNSGQSFFMMSRNKVATVNGTSIGVEEYQNRVQARTEEMQAMYQQNGMSIPEGMASYINQEVYDAMVNEILLTEELDAVGITVSKEELNDLLTGNHIVPQIARSFTNPETGEFDRAAFNNFLQVIFHPEENGFTQPEQLAQIEAQRQIWLNMEKSVMQSRSAEKLSNLLVAALAPNKVDAEMAYNDQNKSVDVAYVLKTYASIPDSTITVMSSDIKAEYNKSKESYKTPETRAIRFITVDIKPNDNDYAKVEERINMLKDQFATTDDVAYVVDNNSDKPYADVYVAVRSMDNDMKTFVEGAKVGDATAPAFANEAYTMYRLMGTKTAPDSVKVRMVNFPLGDSRIDSVYNVLSAGGDIKALGEEFNVVEDVWVTETMAQEVGRDFINAIFTAGNKYFKTESLNAAHVAQVVERTAPVAKAKVATLTMSVIPSNETTTNLYNSLSSYIAKNNDVVAFADSAIVAGYTAMSADCTAEDVSLPGVQDGRQVVRWAFNANKGDISEIFTIGDRYVVAALEEVTKEGYTPMSELENLLASRVRTAKKGDLLVEELAAVTPATMAGYAEAAKMTADTVKFVTLASPSVSGVGYEPAFVGAATALEAGKISAPVRGNRGVYVIEVLNVNENSKPYDEAAQLARMKQQYANVINTQMMQVLKDKAEVENTLIRFF